MSLQAREKPLFFPSVILRAGEEVTLTRQVSSPFLARCLFIEDDVAGSLVVEDLLADRETLLTDREPESEEVLPAPGLAGLGPWPGRAFLHHHGLDEGAHVVFRHERRRPAWEFVLRLRSVSYGSLHLIAGAAMLVGQEFLGRPKLITEEDLLFHVAEADQPLPPAEVVEAFRLNDVLGAVTLERRASGPEDTSAYGVRVWSRASWQGVHHKLADAILSPDLLRAADARDVLFARMIDLARKAEI